MKQPIHYPFPVHYLDLPDNRRIAYMDEGHGDTTILFIHGLANYAPVWVKNLEYLKQYYRCVAIDLPGNGLSDRNEHPFSMMFFADSVKKFIDAARLTNVCLAGHSMGGQIAMTTILMYPELAKHMLLFAPAGFEAFTELDKTMYYTTLHFMDYLSSEENSLRRTMENSFYRLPSQANELIEQLTHVLHNNNLRYYNKMIEACIKSMLEDEVFYLLEKISIPTMVYFGAQDALIPNKLIHPVSIETVAGNAVKRMKAASLSIFDHCGHFVQWEKATEVNQSIHRFLAYAKRDMSESS